MPSSARRIAAALLSCVALTAGIQGGAVEAPPRVFARALLDEDRLALELREYDALIAAYRNGDSDAVKRVASWTPRRLAIVDVVISISHRGDAELNPRRIASAAMLHTDAARLLMGSNDTQAVLLHLELASRLLENTAPALKTLASRWYVVVARVLRDRQWLSTADALLASGRKRMPGDAAVLCESGTLAELLATDREVNAPAEIPMPSRGDFLIESFQRRRSEDLSRASRWLGQGVEAGTADVLCRLHFGRVRGLLDDDRTARSILRELQLGPDVAVGYLASLFLGAIAERRNERDEAERCYRLALARFTGGQSAQVALGALLAGTGRLSEARDLVGGSMGRDQNSRREPWWWYHFEPTDLVEANYEVLRREALR